jgi:hypothetical protein
MYPQIRYIGPSLSTLLLGLYIESKILSITDYGGAVAGLQWDVGWTTWNLLDHVDGAVSVGL